MFGICILPVIPMRKTKSDSSEMINQILFGETFKIKKDEKKWALIELTHDKYTGWICKKQFQLIKEIPKKNKISNKTYCNIKVNNISQPLILGSLIPYSKKYCNNLGINSNLEFFPLNNFNFWFMKIAKKYLNSPYLWGGRTPLGIDCSGYTQLGYRFFGINLPRDSYQQAKKGKKIKSVEKSKLGDLAFFSTKNKITHVGIVLKDKKIIHSSGKVRIDLLDDKGIFNKKMNTYTHQLSFIKRLSK